VVEFYDLFGTLYAPVSKIPSVKVRMPVFQLFYEMKLKTSIRGCFEASEDIITKFKSQTLHVIRIKYL
jgi:hypothetical protein